MRRAIDLSTSEADGSRDCGNLTVFSILLAITKRNMREPDAAGLLRHVRSQVAGGCYPF